MSTVYRRFIVEFSGRWSDLQMLKYTAVEHSSEFAVVDRTASAVFLMESGGEDEVMDCINLAAVEANGCEITKFIDAGYCK